MSCLSICPCGLSLVGVEPTPIGLIVLRSTRLSYSYGACDRIRTDVMESLLLNSYSMHDHFATKVVAGFSDQLFDFDHQSVGTQSLSEFCARRVYRIRYR